MSLLADLLDAKDPLFNLALKQLEDVTGRRGVDAKLVGELYDKAQSRLRQLRLDPADTKGIELYQSLLNLIKDHNQHLARKLGGHDPDDVTSMVPLIIKHVQGLDIPESGWFIKEAVARKFLKGLPPPNTLKQLGYADVESMLQAENIYEVYGALRFAETPEWLNQFIAQYKRLKFKDFEHRPIQIVHADGGKWGSLADAFIKKKLHNITHLKELGVILMLPVKEKAISGFALTEFTFLLHYLYEVKLYSTFFKYMSVKKRFGTLLVDTLIADTPSIPILDGAKRIHWRVIQRYYGKLKGEVHPEIFEPHVQPEDLHWRKAEELLYEFDPIFEFWQDMDYVGLILDKEIVSLNLMDMALCYSQGVDYAGRYLYHMRESLWNEIFVRYMGQRVLEHQILQQLDNEAILPAKIKA